jgi:hypothetical protein
MYNRIPVELEAKIISNGNKYRGVIRNLSIGGLFVTIDTPINVLPSDNIEVRYRLSSKKTLVLYCKVMWFAPENGSQDYNFGMGLAIINPDATYEKFMHSIYKSSEVLS